MSVLVLQPAYWAPVWPKVYWCFHRCPTGGSLRSYTIFFVLMKFLWSISFSDSRLLSLWCLDVSTFIGSRSCLHTLFSHFMKSEPSFGLNINLLSVNYVYWPSGDSSFPNFPLPSGILIQWAAAWIFLPTRTTLYQNLHTHTNAYQN